DDTGRIVGRAQVGSKDLGSAASSAIDGAASAVGGAHLPIGVAAVNPESPQVQAALRALARRVAGRFVDEGAVQSGAAAAVAEAWIGAARGARDVVLFALGEHTTAGVVRDGAPVTGAHRRAASVGWLALNPVEREDYRKTGCLEAEVAAAGIVRRIVWRIKAGDHSRVQDRVDGDLGSITVAHVLEAARQGGGVAISVIRDTAKYAGMAAANLVVVVDPAVRLLVGVEPGVWWVGGARARAAGVVVGRGRPEMARGLPRARMRGLTSGPAAPGADGRAVGGGRRPPPALK